MSEAAGVLLNGDWRDVEFLPLAHPPFSPDAISPKTLRSGFPD
jgi:hypothetical protein